MKEENVEENEVSAVVDTVISLELNYPGFRLDRALAEAHPELSRVQWQKLIREKRVTVDEKHQKASFRLTGGEKARAAVPEAVDSDIVAEDIPLNIVHEDSDIIVVNKPADMVVHPAVGNERGTLVNAVLFHCPDLAGVGGEKRPGIVHRLDKNTSGLIVIAKHDEALRHLQAQFQERTVEKTYLALVDGVFHPEKALVDAPIGRDPKHRKKMVVIPPASNHKSRESQTHFELAEAFKRHSLVRCYPKTGRTHQIRVHLSYINYPIVGDSVYGRRRPSLPLKRHFLHAERLAFVHPGTGERVEFTAELPPKLQSTLDGLREAFTVTTQPSDSE